MATGPVTASLFCDRGRGHTITEADRPGLRFENELLGDFDSIKYSQVL
jgi:hypothetical protein